MNTPDHYVPVGDKIITLNSAHDCLEHPDNEGWIFNIRDHDNKIAVFQGYLFSHRCMVSQQFRILREVRA